MENLNNPVLTETDPSFANGGISDDYSLQEKRLRGARRQSAMRSLFDLDVNTISDNEAAAAFHSITKHLFPELGPDYTGYKMFGGKRAEDPRQNLINLKKVMMGDLSPMKNAKREEFDKLPEDQQIKMAEEDESSWNAFLSWAKGERGEGLLDSLLRNLGPVKGVAPDEEKEKEEYKRDLLKDFCERHPDSPMLQMLSLRGPGGLSDRGQWTLTKGLAEGHIDVPLLMSLDKEEQDAVMAGFALVRGDKLHGRILGKDVDWSTGTVGDRVQMGLYGLQQSLVNLVTDTGKMGSDIAMWFYGQSLSDQNERDAFFEAWTAQERARNAEEQPLPKGDFWGEAYQTLMENLHWVIPYGAEMGLKAAQKSFKAAKTVIGIRKAEMAADFADRVNVLKTVGNWAEKVSAATDSYVKGLATVSKIEKSLATKAKFTDAALWMARSTTFSAFAEEFIRSSDDAGLSREESVFLAAAVGAINARIERIAVPGLESNLTRREIAQMGLKSLMSALKEGEAGRFVGNYLAKAVAAGGQIALEEGVIEEPLQQLTIEWGKRFASGLDEFQNTGRISALDSKNIRGAFISTFTKDINTYLNTTLEMLPAMAGYLVTSGPRQQLSQKSRESVYAKLKSQKSERLRKFAKAMEKVYGERELLPYKYIGAANVLDLVRRERAEVLKVKNGEVETAKEKVPAPETAKPQVADETAAPSTEGVESEPDWGKLNDEQKRLEANDIVSRARQIYRGGRGDVVGEIMKQCGLPLAAAETLADYFAEEDEEALFNPMNRSLIEGETLASIDENTISALPYYVKGSYKADEKGDTVTFKLKLDTDADNKWLKKGETTVVIKRMSNAFEVIDADGNRSLDEAAIAAAMQDNSSYADSWNESNPNRPWSAVEPKLRRELVLKKANALTDSDSGSRLGIEFKDAKTGESVTVNADHLIKLGTGRLADLGGEYASEVADAASMWDLRHEVFHTLWTSVRSLIDEDELRNIAKAFPSVNTNKPGWIDSLDEKLAPEFGKWAGGQPVRPMLDDRFTKLQQWLGAILGKLGLVGNEVEEVYRDKKGKVQFRPFGLRSLYDAISSGRLGSGNLGVERIKTAPAAEAPRTDNAGKTEVSKGEIPVEVSDRERAEQEQKETAAAAGSESNEEPKPEERPEPKPAETRKRSAATDWDFGDRLKMRIPNKPGRVVVRLKVVNIFDLLTSFAEAGTQKYQNRGDTQESKEMRARIAADPDFEQAGAPQAMLGGATIVVDKQGYPIVGNHRVDGIQQAYRGGTAARYRTRTIEEAEARGIEVDERAAAAPILVAEVESIEDNETIRIEELGEAGNTPTMRGFNSYEEAQNDAKIIAKEGIESGLATKPDGSIDSAASLPAIKNFIDKTGAQGMLDDNGVLTEKGQERIGAAMIALLIGTGTDERPLLKKLLSETRKLDIENEVRGIVRVAADLLRLADTRPGYDIRKDLREALAKYTAWREADEAKRAEKNLTQAQWHKKQGYKWEDFAAQQDLFLERNEVADLIAARLAESRRQRSFAQNGDETAAGQERAVRHIAEWFEKFIERASNVNTETDDMFGTPPASVGDLLRLKFSVGADINGLYHGSASDWLVPDLEHIGSGQGEARQGYGLNATTEEEMAKIWGRMAIRNRRPRTLLEQVGYLLRGGNEYLYELSLKDANVLDYYAENADAADRIEAVVASDDRYTAPAKWFDTTGRVRNVQNMERYLINAVRTKDGARLAPAQRAELMVAAGVDAGVVDFSPTEDQGGEKNYTIYNPGKVKVEHKRKNGRQLFSVGKIGSVALDDDFIKLELDKYGTTESANEAAYLLPDGRMLRNKGIRMFGGQVVFGHDGFVDDVKKLYAAPKDADVSWYNARNDAARRSIAEQRFVRISNGGIELTAEPNVRQYDKLRDVIGQQLENIYADEDYDTLNIDYVGRDGEFLFTAPYGKRISPSAVIADIRDYFEKGLLPPSAHGPVVENRQRFSVSGLYTGGVTDTPAFKAWFADSKIVDDNGRPLRVYRGARFNPVRQPDGEGVIKPMSYFSADPDYAGRYGEVEAYYLKIEHPFDIRDPECEADFKKVYPNVTLARGDSGALDWAEASTIDDEFLEENFPGKYDGIIFDEQKDWTPEGSTAKWRGLSYVPLDGGAQVKSATDNRGTFDPANPDVRFSVGGWLPVLRTVDDIVKYGEHPVISYRNDGTGKLELFDRQTVWDKKGVISVEKTDLDAEWRDSEDQKHLTVLQNLPSSYLIAHRSPSAQARELRDEVNRRLGEWNRGLLIGAEVEYERVADSKGDGRILPRVVKDIGRIAYEDIRKIFNVECPALGTDNPRVLSRTEYFRRGYSPSAGNYQIRLLKNAEIVSISKDRADVRRRDALYLISTEGLQRKMDDETIVTAINSLIEDCAADLDKVADKVRDMGCMSITAYDGNGLTELNLAAAEYVANKLGLPFRDGGKTAAVGLCVNADEWSVEEAKRLAAKDCHLGGVFGCCVDNGQVGFLIPDIQFKGGASLTNVDNLGHRAIRVLCNMAVKDTDWMKEQSEYSMLLNYFSRFPRAVMSEILAGDNAGTKLLGRIANIAGLDTLADRIAKENVLVGEFARSPIAKRKYRLSEIFGEGAAVVYADKLDAAKNDPNRYLTLIDGAPEVNDFEYLTRYWREVDDAVGLAAAKRLINPLIPAFAESLWQRLGNPQGSITLLSPWMNGGQNLLRRYIESAVRLAWKHSGHKNIINETKVILGRSRDGGVDILRFEGMSPVGPMLMINVIHGPGTLTAQIGDAAWQHFRLESSKLKIVPAALWVEKDDAFVTSDAQLRSDPVFGKLTNRQIKRLIGYDILTASVHERDAVRERIRRRGYSDRERGGSEVSSGVREDYGKTGNASAAGFERGVGSRVGDLDAILAASVHERDAVREGIRRRGYSNRERGGSEVSSGVREDYGKTGNARIAGSEGSLGREVNDTPRFSVSRAGDLTHIVAEPHGAQKRGETIYPDAGGEISGIRFSVGAKRRLEIRELFRKHRPDVEPADVLAYIDEIDKYDNPKKEKLAIHWLITGAIEIPQDEFKLDKAIKTAERAKVDPFRYTNPEDIFLAFPQYLPKDKATDPDTVSELKNRTELPNGIVVYDVDETPTLTDDAKKQIDAAEDPAVVKALYNAFRERGLLRPAGQLAMRKIINSHWDRDANPWCLLQGDDKGNLTPESAHYWNHYNSLPKRVAFKDGRLLAFMATDSSSLDEQWWDRKDRSYDGVPVEGLIPGDPLGRSGCLVVDSITGSTRLTGDLWRGNKVNGDYETWYSNGRRHQFREYRNGKLNGIEIEWSYGGGATRLARWEDNVEIGRSLLWASEGFLLRDETYGQNGNYNGWVKAYTNGGTLVHADDWRDGRLRLSLNYSTDGDLIGFRRYIDNDNRRDVASLSIGELGNVRSLAFGLNGGQTMSAEYGLTGKINTMTIGEFGGLFRVQVRADDFGFVRTYSVHDESAGVHYSGLWDGEKYIIQAIGDKTLPDNGRQLRVEELSGAHPIVREAIEGIPAFIEDCKIEAEQVLAHDFAARPKPPEFAEDATTDDFRRIRFSAGNRDTNSDISDSFDAVSASMGDDIEESHFSVTNRKFGWDDYPELHDRVLHATSHIHMVGHDDPITDAKYEQFKALKKYDQNAAFKLATEMSKSVWAKERYIGKYLLGKHFGSEPDALEAVRHYYSPSRLEQLRGIIGTRPAKWVYVHNTDGYNTNMMPKAFATLLAEKFGGEVEGGVWKKSDERNTGASMQDRASRNFEWYGEVDTTNDPLVFIVDDVWTTGSTTVSLLEHLHEKGVKVGGIAAVAVASNTDHLKPTDEDWAKVLTKSRTGSREEASRIAGFDMSKLTGSELFAYGVKGTKGKAGLAKWFERAFGLFEVPGGLFSFDPKAPKALQFSVAYPRYSEMPDDDLIVARLVAGMAINPAKATKDSAIRTRYGFFRRHRKETEEMVRRAHPEIANDYGEVMQLAHLLMMRAQTEARGVIKDLERGVSESEILKRIPKKLEPVYRRELAEQRKGGATIMGRGFKAGEELAKRFERAVSVQSGIDSDLFEEWAGVDFSETLAKVLSNRRELSEDKPKGTEPDTVTLPDPESGTGGEGSAVPVKQYKIEELEDPNRFAEYVVALAWKYWREKHGIGKDAAPWNDQLSIQFMRKTAQGLYRQLARDIVYSGARETVVRIVDEFTSTPTIQGLISKMTRAGEIIHDRHIRETKQAMCEQLDAILKNELGAQGRFKPDKEELRRKVSAELELRARYMRHAMWLTREAAADEALRMQQRLDRITGEYDSLGRDVDQSREYRELQRNMNILREFGSLRYRTLGEIEAALNYWQEQAKGSGEAILQAMRDREIRTLKAADILTAAVVNPNTTDRVESGPRKKINDYIVGHMGFISMLQDMVRYSKGEERARAMSIIHYIALEIQKAGDRARAEQRAHSDAFLEAVQRIYRRPFRKVMAEMNTRDERFAPFMNSRGGKMVVPTKGRAMQLLVSLLQGRRPGDDYFNNVVSHGRQGQAEQIAALLTAEDMNIISWLGQWYEDNRKSLSDVAEALFGMGVYSESPRYFPVKMLLEKQGLEKAEGVGWSAFPKALTPRVRNERDFDTEADIFALWMARMQEGAQWKAHAKLGLEMRGIFGRSELQEAIIANHGSKINSLVLGFITDILSGTSSADRSDSGVAKASDLIRGWAALSALGGSVGVMFKQTTSIPAFGFEIGLVNTATYVLSAFSPAGFEAMSKIWNSEQRKTRWDVGSSEAVANALSKRDVGLLKRMFQMSMITNKLGDVVPGLLVGQGIYRDLIEQGASEEDAMAETWMLIERTQQSSRMENQPTMQRRNKIGRVLYQFLSTQQQYLQYEARAVRELAANPNMETAKNLLRSLAINHFILTSLYFWMGELYKMLLGAEPSEDVLNDWIISCLLGPFGALFILGFMCKLTLVRALKGSFEMRRESMLPMESYAKNMLADASNIVSAIFANEYGFDEIIDAAAKLANDANSTFRDIRKIDKNYIRPEHYEQKEREARRRRAEKQRRRKKGE